MMADLDRITELLLSDEEMPDVYYSMLENASDTEPTLDPLNQMIANQKAQDDFGGWIEKTEILGRADGIKPGPDVKERG